MFVRPFRLARLCSLTLALTSVGCVTLPDVPTAATRPYVAPAGVRPPATIRVRVAGRIVNVLLEDYVLGSALSEVSPVGERPDVVERIFEVQTVLARTYALSNLGRHGADGFDLCDSTHCQLYEPQRLRTSRFMPVAQKAVRSTAGQVVLFGSRPARATFHADCGGHTAAAEAVWTGGPVAYLAGSRDEAPAVTHRTWRFTASGDAVRNALNAHQRSAVGNRLQTIRVLERDASGRAGRIQVVGAVNRTLTGEQVRTALNAVFGIKAIQSARFSVTKTGSQYQFDGTGFGHGVGLCQVGAAARARAGQSLERILTAYFPGTRITS